MGEVQSEHLTSVATEYIAKPIKKLPPSEPPAPQKVKVEQVTYPKVDFLSRYEQRKQVLRTERKSMERKETVTQAPFSLDHPPRISIRMRSHRVPHGCNTKFTLNVQAKPEAQIKWFHNEKEIQQGRKYHMSNMSGVLTLQITECVTEDAGTYRVVCKNTRGETSDYATLDVAGEEYAAYSTLRRDEEPPSAHDPEMTRTEVYHVSSSKTTVEETRVEETTTVVETKTVTERKVAPKILTKPQSLTVNEGDVARFECDVAGDPTPSITWLREGTVIGSSFRHHIISTEHNSSFEISSVEMADEGSYSLLVENAAGSQEAFFTLSIRKSESMEKVAERIVSPEALSPLPKSPEIKSPPRVKSPVPIKSPLRMKSPPTVKSPEPIKSPKRVMSPTLEKAPVSVQALVEEPTKMGIMAHRASVESSMMQEHYSAAHVEAASYSSTRTAEVSLESMSATSSMSAMMTSESMAAMSSSSSKMMEMSGSMAAMSASSSSSSKMMEMSESVVTMSSSSSKMMEMSTHSSSLRQMSEGEEC